jgi:hypothetical protein
MRILRIRKIARDARTGRFITARAARRRPNTTVVENRLVPITRVKRGAKR